MVKKEAIKKILFFTLTNIGDVLLTLPSLDYLKETCPNAHFTVVSGPNAAELFKYDPRVNENIIFDKHARLRDKLRFFVHLYRQHFDVIIDLRETAFRWLVPAAFKNPRFLSIPNKIQHVRLRHLYKTMAAFGEHQLHGEVERRTESLIFSKEIEQSVDALLHTYRLFGNDYIIVASGARSLTKRWHQEGFVEVCRGLQKECPIILMGDKQEAATNAALNLKLGNSCIDLTGKTSLSQAIVIIRKARLVVCNDSAFSHIASYFDKPLAVLFGPTDENRYGPWSRQSVVVRKHVLCSPCNTDQCGHDWQCMKLISPRTVINVCQELLLGNIPQAPCPYKRILITRTDRLGDVLLSTPTIANIRKHAPNALIVVMVQKSLERVVRGNPHIDEVLLFDKDREHAGLASTLRLARLLKQKQFDAVFILHPTLRVHLLMFLAGIPERIGYDSKLGKLFNTRVIHHDKQKGERHESDYTLDFVRALGITPFTMGLTMPLDKEAEDWADVFLSSHNLKWGDIILIHAQASCRSRIWPKDYYKRVAQELIARYNKTVVFIGVQRENDIAIHEKIFNLTSETNISQLASLLKRSCLLISCDSGPMHMAVALGIPVIALFGRKQAGVGPKRWRPLDTISVVLQKDVGCTECLAHDCKKEFVCLKALSPEEVLGAAERFLLQQKEKP